MRHWFSALLSGSSTLEPKLNAVRDFRRSFASLTDFEVRQKWQQSTDLLESIALAAIAGERTLKQHLFAVQVQGAIALAECKIAEMQTGEGKTLAAVPAVCWLAKSHKGVHVITVNDYLARRDAAWMKPIYRFLGITVGCIQQGQTQAERRAAYGCDVTYATANNIGFDFLRDRLVLRPEDEVHRPFHAAVIDECDSVLIDEARIPLVIAGGDHIDQVPLAWRVDPAVRHLHRGTHFTVDDNARNVALTDRGIAVVERALGCPNLYATEYFDLLAAAQDALHAHALLRRDVDYIVKNGCIESVDEFQGRIALDRRWPAGLHTAVEAKEGLVLKKEGRILGSMTLQHLVALYTHLCGMTGTAATQAREFQKLYNLDVEVISPNVPCVRNDLHDLVFEHLSEKQAAVIAEIRRIHATGQPVLVGTASVAESDRLSQILTGIPHRVLNAKNDEEEAAIVAQAGQRDALTISTNMAGRGVDIRLGPGVADLGGLYVIGTNKHESQRVDNQLRGRAGRQGDPGTSRFFLSYEDDLFTRFDTAGELTRPTPGQLQRRVEGQNLTVREFLNKYEHVVEGQRQLIHERRHTSLHIKVCMQTERLASLLTIDELWADHLAAVAEIRGGVHWVSWGGRDPLHEFLTRINQLFLDLMAGLDDAIAIRISELEASGVDPDNYIPGATWTYLTTDEAFGSWMQRMRKGMSRKFVKDRS